MKTKKGDFIEIDYTAKIKESNKVFDLTDKTKAKSLNLYNEKQTYKPLIICLGENQVIPGLDEQLTNKEINKQLTLEIEKSKAFGEKNNKLIKVIPLAKFKAQKITPFPGLQLNIDNTIGTVRSVTSGRVIVDFNHPLAGHNLIYEVKINKIIKDTKLKAQSFLELLNIPTDITIKENILKIKNIPEAIQKPLKDKLKTLIKELKDVRFINSKTTSKA